ncbi:MAG TPA: oxidative damage protection protein [Spongiibacteraceae bacterium]|jgi:Fe-S cluster biosynthesis and repair protein YggX|nr:oxidative damage protection protein [Spongiibacteraceae bacterium]HUH37523.1 oxidative damage protection protein [Spongiibacteraceae bacterium]
MTRTVFCRKYKKDLEGLAQPPMPGLMGQDIYDHVSRQAWEEWQAHQTMLINERRLTLRDPESRKFLQAEMIKFFAGEEYAKADGYVPPDKA